MLYGRFLRRKNCFTKRALVCDHQTVYVHEVVLFMPIGFYISLMQLQLLVSAENCFTLCAISKILLTNEFTCGDLKRWLKFLCLSSPITCLNFTRNQLPTVKCTKCLHHLWLIYEFTQIGANGFTNPRNAIEWLQTLNVIVILLYPFISSLPIWIGVTSVTIVKATQVQLMLTRIF